MTRTTKREIEAVFCALMRTVNGDHDAENPYQGYARNPDGTWKAVVGRYYLDHAACYGGWCIERISNTNGGGGSITMHGLSAGRMTGSRFVESMRFAIDLHESLR